MIIAALLLMQAAPAAETGSCRVLHGGFAEGMCVGSVDPDEGGVLVTLLPAPASGPPIPPDIARVVDRLLKAHASGAANLPKTLLAEGATARFCTDWTEQCMKAEPLVSWPLGSYYSANRPYRLSDGRIRIEWQLGVKLDYLSLITFDGKKVKSMDTTPATIPMARPPGTR